MSATNFNIRIDEDIHRQAEAICQDHGSSLSTAETLQAMTDAREHRDLAGPFHDAASVMEALNDEA